MAEDKYWSLPVAFYFQVQILDEDYAFKEVSGLDTEMDLETIREGGSNDFEYKVPKHIKHSNLVLKRAQMPVDSYLVSWVKDVLEGDLYHPIVPQNVQIRLLNSDGSPMYNWFCSRAYPVKWSVEPLDAEKNSILIESLELAYTTLYRS